MGFEGKKHPWSVCSLHKLATEWTLELTPIPVGVKPWWGSAGLHPCGEHHPGNPTWKDIRRTDPCDCITQCHKGQGQPTLKTLCHYSLEPPRDFQPSLRLWEGRKCQKQVWTPCPDSPERSGEMETKKNSLEFVQRRTLWPLREQLPLEPVMKG